jgi:hypothetical protein
MAERKVIKDYLESAVSEVFALADPSSWHDLVRYLETSSEGSWRTSPGEGAHMIADAKQAMKDNVPFAHNPEQAYRVMKSHRNPELVRQEEQKWLGQDQRAAPTERLGRKQA